MKKSPKGHEWTVSLLFQGCRAATVKTQSSSVWPENSRQSLFWRPEARLRLQRARLSTDTTDWPSCSRSVSVEITETQPWRFFGKDCTYVAYLWCQCSLVFSARNVKLITGQICRFGSTALKDELISVRSSGWSWSQMLDHMCSSAL